MASKSPIQFRNVDLEPILQARVGNMTSSLGAVASRDLERYYKMLREALRSVTLTVNEASLLVDLANGTIWMPETVTLLWAQVEESKPHCYPEKWDVDADVLIAKLRPLSQLQCLAIVDAIERFWLLGKGEITERLEYVGLVEDSVLRSLTMAGLVVEKTEFVTREESDAIHTQYLEMIGDKQLNLTQAILDERASQGILSQDLKKVGLS